MPESYRSEDGAPKFDEFSAHYQEVVAQKAQLDERMSEVPEAAEGYEFAVPQDLDFGDLELPEGVKIDLAPDDPEMQPLFQELGSVLHKHQVPKGAAQELSGLLAKYEAARVSREYTAMKSEMESLGQGAQARLQAVERALDTKLPADMAGALKGATKSAAGLKALERLLMPRAGTTPTAEPTADPLQAALAARYPQSATA